MLEVDFKSEYFDHVVGIVDSLAKSASQDIWLNGRSIESTVEILTAYFELGVPKGIDPLAAILKPLFLAGDDPEVRTAECRKVIERLVESFDLKMAAAFKKLLEDNEVGKVEVLTLIFEVLKSLEDKQSKPFPYHRSLQFLVELNLDKLFSAANSNCRTIIIEIVTYFDYEIKNFVARVLTLGTTEEIKHFGKKAHCTAVIYLEGDLRFWSQAKKALLLFANLNLHSSNIRANILDIRHYDKFYQARENAFGLLGQLSVFFLKERDIEALNYILLRSFYHEEYKPQISFLPEGDLSKHSLTSVLILNFLKNEESNPEDIIVALNSLPNLRHEVLVRIFSPISEQVKNVLEGEKEFSIRKATALFIMSLVTPDTETLDEIMNDLSGWTEGVDKDVDMVVRELLKVINPTDSFMIYLKSLSDRDNKYLPYLARAVKYRGIGI